MDTIVGIAIKARVIDPESAVNPVDKLNIFLIKGLTLPSNKPITQKGWQQEVYTCFHDFFGSPRCNFCDKESARNTNWNRNYTGAAVTKMEPIMSGKMPN